MRPDAPADEPPAGRAQWWEHSSFFHATNTNKRGVTLDMATDRGRALAHQLVTECDVVVENYSPRVMEAWGLGWDDVRARRPDTIMVRMPAFGLSGPWRDRTGFAMTMEQVSGMAWMTGFPEHAPGALFGPCDPGAGLHAALGLMVALDARRRTGQGVLVEAPMVAGALNVAVSWWSSTRRTGALSRAGNVGPAAPQNCYLCGDVDDEGARHRWWPSPWPTTTSGRRYGRPSTIRRGRPDPRWPRWRGGGPYRTTSSTPPWRHGAPSGRRPRWSSGCGRRACRWRRSCTRRSSWASSSWPPGGSSRPCTTRSAGQRCT